MSSVADASLERENSKYLGLFAAGCSDRAFRGAFRFFGERYDTGRRYPYLTLYVRERIVRRDLPRGLRDGSSLEEKYIGFLGRWLCALRVGKRRVA